MGKLKIKSEDTVKVITGDYKGSEGKVISITKDKKRAIVEGVNMVKKHLKPDAKNPQGGIIEKEAPIEASNVAIWNADANKADRVGFKVLEDGKKVRVYKSSGEVIGA